MKNNVLFLLITMFTLSMSIHAQRGVRIGYVDTEYILENIPEYKEALSQLDKKAEKWSNEIQTKLATIEQKRKDLSNEKALLTKELIDEREEDIDFEEQEILNYQQKRFGPNGDLTLQRQQLMQPVQDQIFAAVQDLATSRKYDFIFDKSADVVMLYSAKKFDLSEQILKSIKRASKRKQIETKAERKEVEDEDIVPEKTNLDLEERKKAIEEKKEARKNASEKIRQDKLAAREAKIKEVRERRKKILEERAQARQAKLASKNKTKNTKTSTTVKTTKANSNNEAKKTRAELIEKKIKEREARKKALQEKRKQILRERQRVKDSIKNNK